MHGNGVEWAGLRAGAKSQAANGAGLGTAIERCGRPAVPESIVKIFEISMFKIVSASRKRYFRFAHADFNAKDARNLDGNGITARNAHRGARLARNHGSSGGSAARKTTGTAI